jgi:hypothetical protein
MALKEILSAKIPALLEDLSQVKTYIRTVVVVVLGGAGGAVYEYVSNTGNETALFSPASIAAMKAKFMYGAFMAILGLVCKSPLQQMHNAEVGSPKDGK